MKMALAMKYESEKVIRFFLWHEGAMKQDLQVVPQRRKLKNSMWMLHVSI